MKTYVVGLSGGVDSAVAAYLCQKKGHVIGLFMKNWNGPCSSEQDFEDVKKICSQLNIDYYLVNYTEDYQERVFKNFLQEWKEGKTPNPDVLCNSEIKFDLLLKEALNLGADYLVTGHYAQSQKGLLYRAKDSKKDQTYFLHQLSIEQLKKSYFPLGSYLKSEVKDLAKKLNLSVAEKKESMGICFIGKQPMKAFLKQYLEEQQGDIVHIDSKKVLGQHEGIHFYTKGQRKGLHLGGQKESLIVIEKDLKKKILYVGSESHEKLFQKEVLCESIHWIGEKKERVLVKSRHQGQEAWASVQDNQVIFDEAQRALTEGQYVVFYDEEKCLGGGKILLVR